MNRTLPFASKHAGIPSDPLRDGMVAQMDGTDPAPPGFDTKELSSAVIAASTVIFGISCAVYIYASSVSLVHNEDFWPVDRSLTLVGGLTAVCVVATIVISGIVKKYVRKPIIPKQFGWLLIGVSVALLPLFYLKVYLDVRARDSARPIEKKQWFLVERDTSCRRGRRGLFRNCENFHQGVWIYPSTGNRFSADRYGDATRYACALGRRIRASNGHVWLKVERIELIDYDTDYHGRLTKQGRLDLVNCTKPTGW